MIKLTPIEIERHEFKTVWRGYDPDEVKSFLAQVAHQLTTMIREQEKSEEALELKAQRLAQVEDYEIRLRDALIAASSLAEQSREEARREAELLIKEAELQADRIVKEGRESLHQLLSETQSLKRQRERLSVELRSVVESHLRMLENQEHLRTAQERWRDEESEWDTMTDSILKNGSSSQPSNADKGDTLLEARELTLALGNSLGEELLASSPQSKTNVSHEILSPSIPEPLTNRPLSASRLDLPKAAAKTGSLASSKSSTLVPKALEVGKISSGSGEASSEKSGLAKLQQVLSEVPRRAESEPLEQVANEAQVDVDSIDLSEVEN